MQPFSSVSILDLKQINCLLRRLTSTRPMTLICIPGVTKTSQPPFNPGQWSLSIPPEKQPWFSVVIWGGSEKEHWFQLRWWKYLSSSSFSRCFAVPQKFILKASFLTPWKQFFRGFLRWRNIKDGDFWINLYLWCLAVFWIRLFVIFGRDHRNGKWPILIQKMWHALRDFLPFMQFEKRQKHPGIVTFSKFVDWSL